MLVDEAEIGALLAQAGGEPADASVGGAVRTQVAVPPAPLNRAPGSSSARPAVQRILKIRVPVIVQLARRTMMIAAIRKLAPGSIVEFEQSVSGSHDLLVNNSPIGRGKCVTIGEHFGLQITEVLDRVQRIRSLGPQH